MSAASLSLLKGGKKEAVQEELEAKQEEVVEVETEATGEADGEETTVDVDVMDSDELDNLTQEFGIETPAEWSGWGAEEKRAWLKEQFDDGSGEGEKEDAPAKEEPKAETKKAEPKKAAAKKTTAKAKETPVEETKAEEPAKEEPKKASAKGKAVAKSTTKSGEVQAKGDDVLSDLIHEIETMQEKQARLLVKELSEQTEVTFFKLGGVLSVIQANGWYEPYASFREFVEKEHGLHYRKATYWVGIYNNLAESKVPWAKVAHLGWTKLKEIAGVITLENVDEWVKIAEQQNTISLIETVKAHLAKGAPKNIEDQTSKTTTTKTFKVHEDQKEVIEAALEKAKGEANTQVDTVALEYICGDYLSAQTLAQKLKGMGIEAALEALEKAFPNAKIEVELTEEEGAEAA